MATLYTVVSDTIIVCSQSLSYYACLVRGLVLLQPHGGGNYIPSSNLPSLGNYDITYVVIMKKISA